VCCSVWLVNRITNDSCVYLLAFHSPTLSTIPTRGGVNALGDVLDSLTMVRKLVQKLLEVPENFWKVVGGDVGSAKLMRATIMMADGAEGDTRRPMKWVYEEMEGSGGMPDGDFDYYAFAGEPYLRAALASLSCDSTLWPTGRALMKGTLTVKDGALERWTNTVGTYQPLDKLPAQALLPVDLMWRYRRSGSISTAACQIICLPTGGYLEKSPLMLSGTPTNPGTRMHDSGTCDVCTVYLNPRVNTSVRRIVVLFVFLALQQFPQKSRKCKK